MFLRGQEELEKKTINNTLFAEKSAFSALKLLNASSYR